MFFRRQKLAIALCIFFLALCYNLSQLQAQSINIQSMQIIPAQPTNTDTITLIVTANFASGPCKQIVNYLNVLGNSISIQAGHNLGPLTYICNSIDTFLFGPLQSGFYNLTHTINAGGYFTTDTLSFSVSSIQGVDENINESLINYPNPADDYFVLQAKQRINDYKIELLDLSGKQIKTILSSFKNEKNEIVIDTRLFPNGVYFVNLKSDIEEIILKQIIQH